MSRRQHTFSGRLAPVVDVVERRLVAAGPSGRAEWHLVLTDKDALVSEWKPRLVTLDGGHIIHEPAWMPLPGSQYLFLNCPIFETIYEGERGSAKTLALLMDYASGVGAGYGKAWRGILFRKKFGDLDDVVRKIEDWFPRMFPQFRFLRSKSEYAAVWPTGETLLLRHFDSEEDYAEYHGHEYPWIGWEELTQWESLSGYKMMMSCCRPPAAGVPTRVRATTNPYGAGHNAVKKRFKLPDYRGRVIHIPGELPRVAIRGTLAENFVLMHSDPTYRTKVAVAARNLAERKAWEEGDWNVTSGGICDDQWNKAIHVVPDIDPVQVPRGWTITRSYDHGQSHPFAVGWWLESNGEPIEIGNRLVGRVRGDLVLLEEWYGCRVDEPEVGVRLASSDIARGIVDREEEMGIRSRVIPGPADTEIFNREADRMGLSPADDMLREGVDWERADKSHGSRKRGWELLRTRLKDSLPNPDGTREKPGLFICERCRYWIEFVPPMPRSDKDPDDVPSKYPDHHGDQTRYRLSWQIPGAGQRSF